MQRLHAPAHGGLVPAEPLGQIEMDEGTLAAIAGGLNHLRQRQNGAAQQKDGGGGRVGCAPHGLQRPRGGNDGVLLELLEQFLQKRSLL